MQISDVLKVAANGLKQHATRDQLGDQLRTKLHKLADVTERLLSEVEAVQQLILLDVGGARSERPDFSSLSIPELVEASELLGAIYRAGVTIKAHETFSDAEYDLSEKIAERFHEFSPLMKRYRGARDGRDGKSFLVGGGPTTNMFLKLLVASGIIKIGKILLKNKKGWAPFKTEWLVNSTESQTLMVIYTVEDSALNHFLSGDWMTAFVMKVVKDHLDRNKIPNETFAKLSYTAPVDVIRSRSDFDVITLFAEQAHCFECKSGPITQSIADDVMKKATEISGVLEKFAPDIKAFSFYVVYDRAMVADEDMSRMFSASGVRPIRTDQIRELIFDLI